MEAEMNQFIGYEYKDVIVKKNYVSLYEDGYENFGWKLESTVGTPNNINCVTMKFKRDRKLKNKHEVAKMQRKFDDLVTEIDRLETHKVLKASAIAYVIGVIGSGFMALSVFSTTMWHNNVAMIIFAIIAVLGWVFPYLIYRRIKEAKTIELSPIIDDKYDEIYALTKTANEMIHQAV